MFSSNSIKEYVLEHQLDSLVGMQTHENQNGAFDTVNPEMTDPYKPNWDDLVRLHRLIRERKVTTILEFGCGYSTIVMAHALKMNEAEHGEFVRSKLRRSNSFELHSVDDLKQYVEITRSRIPTELIEHVHLSVSPVAMTTFNGRICTEYESLPNICPDFIYLDAPSQHSPIGNVNGISTAHPDRLPMSADILKFEHFLLPGTFIIVDGRTANARFLKANLQNNWSYNHDAKSDIHTFELRTPPLGELNQIQIEYCLGKEWISKVDQEIK